MPCSPRESPLRKFIALQQDVLLMLGPRRVLPLSAPFANTATSVTISTAQGYRSLEVSDFISLSIALKPDIIVGPADMVAGSDAPKPGLKRKDKMDERTSAWMRGMQKALGSQGKDVGTITPSLWAPLLPLEEELQRSYRDHLQDSGPEAYGGLVLYDSSSVLMIPSSFNALPRLAMTSPQSPQAVLSTVDIGIDMVTIPFINIATEAGIALTFTFPAPSPASTIDNGGKLALGFSLWNKIHATSLAPLVSGCPCYACSVHHRAYIRHLLDAKEMLAWVLLQVHNHHAMDAFFEGVRASIAKGTFAADKKAFGVRYTDELPTDGGEGPRVRGYQIKSSDRTPNKANRPARRKLEKAELEAISAKKAERARQKLDDEAQKLAEAMEGNLDDGDILGATFDDC